MSAPQALGGLRVVEATSLRVVALDEVAAVVLLADGTAAGRRSPAEGLPVILRSAAGHLGLSAPRLLRRTANGRPYLVHPSGDRWEVDFNISHSGDLVGIVIGVAGRFGLDVQELPRPGWERIGRRWLHAGEWARIDDMPAADGRLEFTRVWTVREARCKATGRGLAGFRSPTAMSEAAAGSLDGVHWRELPMPDGYLGAVAWAGPPEREWPIRPVVVGWEAPWTR
jgi:4'-phosphopantetheinyl transferase superfamily